MKLKMNLYLNGLKKIKRTIQVNDNISMQLFCKYVIYSMNGNCKHLYQLTINEEYSYLCPTCYILDYETEEMMEDKTIEDLDLCIGDELMVNYDFKSDWEFILEVIGIEKGYYDREFEVTSGEYCGILEDCFGVHNLIKLTSPKLNNTDKEIFPRMFKGFKDYNINEFNLIEINNKIVNKFKQELEQNKPKNYILNVSLEGYAKEIKRKFAVDSNVGLTNLCECIIVSMKGDLSHPYSIKINKEYLDENIINEQDLNYLELKEKQKFKIIYDFGDNWIFNITVSKINDEYGPKKRVEVLSGKGYGIVDDCGGVYGLHSIFNGTNEYFGYKDINDFNLEEINSNIDIYV